MSPRRRSAAANASRPQRSNSPSNNSGPGMHMSRSLPDPPLGDPIRPPAPWPSIKGIMKLKTLDESLHSKYGSEPLSTASSGGKKIHIEFKNIEVREYGRTVGDNPSVSSGPPMTISWEYNPNTTILSVEEYERSRPTRRTQSEMVLPRSIRMEMLRKEWGVSQSQIAQAVRSGIRSKSQRRTTLGNLGRTEKVEELIEGATKQLLKTLFLRKSTSKTAQELGNKSQKVKQQRAQIVLERMTEGEYSESSYSASPWAADLLPDDSDTDWNKSQDTILEKKSQTVNQSQTSRMEHSNDSSGKDDAPKKPPRPEPSDSDVGGDLSSSSSNEKEAEVQPKQSTGECAVQDEGFVYPAPWEPVCQSQNQSFVYPAQGEEASSQSESFIYPAPLDEDADRRPLTMIIVTEPLDDDADNRLLPMAFAAESDAEDADKRPPSMITVTEPLGDDADNGLLPMTTGKDPDDDVPPEPKARGSIVVEC